MPTFSIVIPAYDNAHLLEACLNSVKAQSFDDWEAIVVNDASPDNTKELVRRMSENDARIIAINKPVNEGRHLARRTGTEKASGSFITYLDADDELMPNALEQIEQALQEQPADLLRFGTHVKSAGASEQACAEYERRANQQFPIMSGRESVRLSFEAESGFQQDWRTWGNVLTNNLAKHAFQQMTRERLDRAEDALEFLAFASLAEKQITRPDIVGYCYNFGCGITGPSPLSADQFCKHAHEFASCLLALENYANAFTKFDLKEALRGARIKLHEIMFNDWKSRVPNEEKEATYPELISLFGNETVATQLMRLTRDIAYEKLVTGGAYNHADEWVGWFEKANQIMADTGGKADWLYRQVSAAATRHVAELRTSERLSSQSKQDIRIFVSTHTDTSYFDSDILQMVQVGSSQAARKYPYCFYDDQGDNISDLNPMYCELTAQYWAWKNVDAAYYGFCHYRRYFDFSDERHQENGWGEIMDESISPATQERYCLDDTSIRKAVEGFDVITTESKTLSNFPIKSATPLDHWHEAPSLIDDDLIDTLAIVCELYPDYADDIAEFTSSTKSCFCNMFIMRKEIFHDYCSWLFPILEEFCNTRDMSLYSRETLRTPGHLAERLLNIYLMHHQRIGSNWKTKQCQCVHFKDTSPAYMPLIPSESEAKHKPLIPVVLAADNNYVPMLATTIRSMLANASDDYCYDIVILTSGISIENQAALRDISAKTRTACVRFFDVNRLIDVKGLTTNNEHISVETYYRFLIQDILPEYDKVIYLDSDIIVQGDVAELYATELGDNLLAAVRDVDYLGNLNMKDGERLAYTNSVLNMQNPYDYFQAGVLVLNTAALRKEIPASIWFEHALDARYIYNDQDILNACCEGRVVFLDPSWNVMHNGHNRISRICSHAPASVYEAYLASRKREWIIHYAGSEKPWNSLGCDRLNNYWVYARQTPFYEQLLMLLAHNSEAEFERRERERNDYQIVGDNSVIRKIVDPVLPPDSQRREAIRSVVKTIQKIGGSRTPS